MKYVWVQVWSGLGAVWSGSGLNALCHFVVWILFDVQLLWGELIKDVIKRPFISFGFLSLVGLLPLAVTSNFISIKKLGLVNWKRLHVLIYPAGFFAGAHYVMVKKVWEGEALIYLTVILGLFVIRSVSYTHLTLPTNREV